MERVIYLNMHSYAVYIYLRLVYDKFDLLNDCLTYLTGEGRIHHATIVTCLFNSFVSPQRN